MAGSAYKRKIVRFRNVSLGNIFIHVNVLINVSPECVAGCVLTCFTVFQANSNLQGIVVVEKTRLSEQYFPPLQKFVVLELGLNLLPVLSPAEASQLIIQLVY